MSNNVSIGLVVGNIGKDPDIKHLDSGTTVANFSVATNKSYKQGEEWKSRTTWHRIVAWRYIAEQLERRMERVGSLKGKQVFVQGDMEDREWTDSDGNKQVTREITANIIKWMGKKDDDEQQAAPQQNQGAFTGDDDLPF